MKEAFLHGIWQTGKFNHSNLKTTDGRPLEILSRGDINHDSGPDFFNARLRIGGAEWAGNVEIHIRASDWNLHNHSTDNAYLNTILHVVLIQDTEIILASGQTLACLELQPRIPDSMYALNEAIVLSDIPCRQLSPGRFPGEIHSMVNKGLLERLGELSDRVLFKLKEFRGDWHQVAHWLLFRSMGLKVNAIPMEELAMSVPHTLLLKFRTEPILTEALLFGQAGFLSIKCADDYFQTLVEAYSFIRHKHSLLPVSTTGWKWMRMRPGSFPHIRLARLAGILHSRPNWFSEAREARNIQTLLHLFQGSEMSGYWTNHNRFGEECTNNNLTLPSGLNHQLLINAIIPFLVALDRYLGVDIRRSLIYDLLNTIPAENNKLGRLYESAGFCGTTAAESQGIIGLHQSYCKKGKCLNCAIGLRIISG